jgi:hypothetical protein
MECVLEILDLKSQLSDTWYITVFADKYRVFIISPGIAWISIHGHLAFGFYYNICVARKIRRKSRSTGIHRYSHVPLGIGQEIETCAKIRDTGRRKYLAQVIGTAYRSIF